MIDMQNSYLRQDVRDALGWPPIWRLAEVTDECQSLLSVARDLGVPVVYSRQTTTPAGHLAFNPRAARHFRARSSVIPNLPDAERKWRSQVMDAVAPQPGDLVLDKTRHSFFAYTELDPILRTLGVARLIVAGLQTNVCVEATVRAALERNYEVAVAENAVSTDGPALHTGSLNSMRVIYVEVAPWQELIEPTATWSHAYQTPDYGRDPSYWSDPTISALEGQRPDGAASTSPVASASRSNSSTSGSMQYGMTGSKSSPNC
ncbi:cysteine hydrolase family protein [Nocardia lijiangensis]|uniref:cysteine hydrolase family protein n=1 Tax=Nocardia lijiangensis TaxID=299618 RepID=UPI000836F8F3|nr:cysteine hydrolase [Nocardia lijiangensis]